MILDRLVETNLLTIVSNSNHSWESAIVSFSVVAISLSLYFYWTKRNALLNFRSWSLLIALINFLFFVHHCPLGPHILVHTAGDSHSIIDPGLQEYQFTAFTMTFLRFLEFVTSAITIWRLWKISEQYIPNRVMYQKLMGDDSYKKSKKQLLMRGLAIWHTFKNGGNHKEDTKKIAKDIKNRIISG